MRLKLVKDFYAPWYHPLEAGYEKADYELDVEPPFYHYYMHLQAEVEALNETLEQMIKLAEAKDE